MELRWENGYLPAYDERIFGNSRNARTHSTLFGMMSEGVLGSGLEKASGYYELGM